MLKKALPILLIIVTVLLLYYPALTTFFSQDDFFMFKVSQTNGTLTGFLKLFAPVPFAVKGIAFYRPVFRESLHNIYYSIFGLDQIPFRILLFTIHFFNAFLVYKLINMLFKRKNIAFFTALFFAISAANVSTLYYLAGGIEAEGATMFGLLSLVLYRKNFFLSLLFFILGLASHEIIMMIPLVLAGKVLIDYPKGQRLNNILKLWPFFLALFVLLYIDFFRIGFSTGETQYQPVFNIKTLAQSFGWYCLWAFGLPETLIDYVLPGLKLNPNLMRYWSNYYVVIFPAFAAASTLLMIFVVHLLIRAKKVLLDRRFLLLVLWLLVGLLPVIFLPAHKSSHYLIFVLPAFWGTIVYICFNSRMPKFLAGLFLFSAFLLSAASARLGSENYWAATRGKLAETLISEVKTTYPTLPKSAVVYFRNDPTYPHLNSDWGGTSKQASLILNRSDAIQLLYKDPAIKVYYEDFGAPRNLNNVYALTARLN